MLISLMAGSASDVHFNIISISFIVEFHILVVFHSKSSSCLSFHCSLFLHCRNINGNIAPLGHLLQAHQANDKTAQDEHLLLADSLSPLFLKGLTEKSMAR